MRDHDPPCPDRSRCAILLLVIEPSRAGEASVGEAFIVVAYVTRTGSKMIPLGA
jgi:hypothetical protein